MGRGPYAAPPVGELRWPPAAAVPWEGVRAATAFGSGCPQNPSLNGRPSANEDCLFVNIDVQSATIAGFRNRECEFWESVYAADLP